LLGWLCLESLMNCDGGAESIACLAMLSGGHDKSSEERKSGHYLSFRIQSPTT